MLGYLLFSRFRLLYTQGADLHAGVELMVEAMSLARVPPGPNVMQADSPMLQKSDL